MADILLDNNYALRGKTKGTREDASLILMNNEDVVRIGSGGNQSTQIFGNGTLGITVDSGDVGIGKTIPEAKLHVHGSAAGPSATGLLLTRDDGGPFMRFQAEDKFAEIQFDGSLLHVQDGTGNPIETIALNAKVGIGTTDPGAKLHVGSGDMLLDNNYALRGKTKAEDNELLVCMTNEDVLRIGSGGNQSTQIFGNGTLGITVDSGDVKIEGALKIKDWELSVAPDYVFDDDYELMGLQDLEQYVRTNRHLPDIPTGKEMKKDGVDLGKLCMSLLKKVEELSLHVIRQNHLIDGQQKRINTLEDGLALS